MASAPPEGVDLLSSPARRAIVDHIANLPLQGETGTELGSSRRCVTAATLAEVLNLHVTTTRFHLDQLVNGRILEASFIREGVGRPRKVYRLAQGAVRDTSDSQAIRMLTHLLAQSFGDAAAGELLTPFEAGRRWAEQHVSTPDIEPAATPGAWLAKVGRLVDVLREWGYTPHLSTSDTGRTVELYLAQCPFLDVARSHPTVVCGIHRGLIAGTLERLGERDAEISLEPFAGPRHCIAHVTTHSPFLRSPLRSAVSDSVDYPVDKFVTRIAATPSKPTRTPRKEMA